MFRLIHIPFRLHIIQMQIHMLGIYQTHNTINTEVIRNSLITVESKDNWRYNTINR